MHRKGRFEKSMDSEAAEYSNSLKEDLRLFDSVIQINIAHVRMLMETNIIKKSTGKEILNSLSSLYDEDLDSLNLRPELEDIHMVIEEYVKDEVGEETGGKLHTAKSRNDQVSAAIRMVLREEILETQELTIELIKALMKLAEEHTETVMPGYTHLQVAEPTTFAHYLNNYAEAFTRDVKRLNEAYEQINRSPLGGCAFAGTSFPIDRELTSDLLGFEGILENTMDATGSRDFVLQTMSDLSILMSNLSRMAEEIVLWSSTEFNMLNVPDEFSSTSSIMPQKKNPVTAELGRAKTGKVVGNLIGGLNMTKNLPQAYNLDLQELTPLLWDSVDQTKSSLKVMSKLVEKIKPNPKKMQENAKKGFAPLTELANTIVRETNTPFRKAHAIVGQLAAQTLEEEKSLDDLTLKDLQNASKEILKEKIELSENQFRKALDLNECVNRRKIKGGPSPQSVEDELSKINKEMENYESILEEKKKSLSETKESLIEFSKGD